MAETPTLRPLGVGEILDAGIKIYLRHWKPLMICVVGIVLPVQILSVLVLASIDSGTLDTFGSGSSSSQDPSGSEIAAFLAVALISALSTLLATAACFKAVADAWLGSTPEAGRSLRFGLSRFPALIWLSIVTAAGLALALLALVIPAIWLFVAWSLAVPALLFERVGAFRALRRSFGLVRGRWLPTCGALIVAYLLASIVGGIVQLIPSGIAQAVAKDSVVADAVAVVVGGTVSLMISTPFTAAILTLLYFDMRVRKEGFDLQLLAEGLGSTRDPDAPVPAPLIGPDEAPEPAAAQRQWWQDPEPAGRPDPSSTYGGGYARPEAPGGGMQSGDPLAAAGDPPPDERGADDDASKPPTHDPKRADWLPPEAPRGPGGL